MGTTGALYMSVACSVAPSPGGVAVCPGGVAVCPGGVAVSPLLLEHGGFDSPLLRLRHQDNITAKIAADSVRILAL